LSRSSIIARGLLGSIALVLVVGCSAGASPAASPVPSNAPSAAAVPDGFPIGTWVVTITEADLRAAGITEPAGIRENSGTFTRTYAADGTWTVVQSSSEPVAMPVFRGTWRASGPNELEETTTFPPEYAGDAVRFTWAREGANLVLRVVNPPDPILPVVTEAHPWAPG